MAKWPYNTARWQKLRRLKLRTDPLCEGCHPHRLTYAEHVDHVVPISSGGNAFPGLDGLRSLCPPCHSAKTARGAEAGAIRTDKPRRGCDENGNPLDPNHPWSDNWKGVWRTVGPGKSLKADSVGPAADKISQLVNQNGKKAERNG